MKSWDVCLMDRGGAMARVEKHKEDCVCAASGLMVSDINVTYNYSHHLTRGLGVHFEELNGRRAGDVVEMLQRGVDVLGTERADSYWAKTPGNAGAALATLLGWARQHPDAIFEIV